MSTTPGQNEHAAERHDADPRHDEDQKIRERAYHLWERDGGPHGQDMEYWERARALVGMESNPEAGLLPNPVPPGADRPTQPDIVDEAALEDNLGEIPGRLTDQGDRPQTPARRRRKQA